MSLEPLAAIVPLSAGMTIAAWEARGIASRELGYYSALAMQAGTVEFLSYGEQTREDAIISNWPNLNVSCLPWALPFGRYTSLARSIYGPLVMRASRKFHLVRTNQFDGAWAGRLLAWKLGIPFILRCGYVFSKHYEKRRPSHPARVRWVRQLEKRIAESAAAVIVTYSGAKDFFVNVHGIDPEKVHVIGNALDLELFSRDAKPDARSGDVICVARHEPQKNLPALIEACASLGISLTLVGSGKLTGSLRSKAAALHADVRFLGQVPNNELPGLLRAHRIFALPSFYEGNPKAVLEAMATMTPVVASDIPEHRNIIADGVDGILCGTDPSDMAAKLRLALDNMNLRDVITSAARARVARENSDTSNAAREVEIWRQCCSIPSLDVP